MNLEEANKLNEERRKDLQLEISKVKALITGPEQTPANKEARRQLHELQAQMCELNGQHEYSMVYNDGWTCMDCGYNRPIGEESGVIRSVSGVEVPTILCDLARALPMPVCPPEHTLREHPDYCKACMESRDEIQQLVDDGNLDVIAIVVGVYLRRLYAEHEQITAAVESLKDMMRPIVHLGMMDSVRPIVAQLDIMTGVLEMIFAEVLGDEDRGVPTDDETRATVREALGVETNEEAAEMIRRELRLKSAQMTGDMRDNFNLLKYSKRKVNYE